MALPSMFCTDTLCDISELRLSATSHTAKRRPRERLAWDHMYHPRSGKWKHKTSKKIWKQPPQKLKMTKLQKPKRLPDYKLFAQTIFCNFPYCLLPCFMIVNTISKWNSCSLLNIKIGINTICAHGIHVRLCGSFRNYMGFFALLFICHRPMTKNLKPNSILCIIFQ